MANRRSFEEIGAGAPPQAAPDLAGQDLLALLAQLEGLEGSQESPFANMSNQLMRLLGMGLPSQGQQQDLAPIPRRKFNVGPMGPPSVTPNPPGY